MQGLKTRGGQSPASAAVGDEVGELVGIAGTAARRGADRVVQCSAITGPTGEGSGTPKTPNDEGRVRNLASY